MTSSCAKTLCGGVLVLGLFSQSLHAQSPKAQKSASSAESAVLVRINGHVITESDYQFLVKTRKLTAEDVGDRREVLIERLIDRHLLRAFLDQKKIAADPKLLDEYLTRMKLRLKMQGEEFEQILGKFGFTEESLRREMSLPLDWEAYAGLVLTDKKLREAWQQRKHEFDGSEVQAAHIVLKVRTDKPSPELARAEQKLRDVRSEIVNDSLSFAAAAKKYSDSPDSRDKGGDLGRFGYRGLQPPPFPQVAFDLKVGEISRPFRTPDGVHLLTVTRRIEGQLSLEDARPEIRQRLSLEWQQDVLQQERVKAKIERVAKP